MNDTDLVSATKQERSGPSRAPTLSLCLLATLAVVAIANHQRWLPSSSPRQELQRATRKALTEPGQPSRTVCAAIAKLLPPQKTSPFVNPDPSLLGLYHLAQAGATGLVQPRRAYELYTLILSRHGVEVLRHRAEGFFTQLVTVTTKAGATADCARLLEPQLRGAYFDDCAEAAATLAIHIVDHAWRDQRLAAMEPARRLLVPVLWADGALRTTGPALDAYLTCLTAQRTALARRQVFAAIDRFLAPTPPPGIDRAACAYRCAAIVAFAWEPSVEDKQRAFELLAMAEAAHPPLDLLVQIRCLEVIMTTRSTGGGYLPPAALLTKAHAMSRALVERWGTHDTYGPVVHAVHAMNSSHLGRGEEGLRLMDEQTVEMYPPPLRWLYHFCRAWILYNLKRRKEASAEMARGRDIALPEFRWYLALQSEGFNATRLLDHLFEP